MELGQPLFATAVSWGAGDLTYGFAILGSCSAVMPRRTGLLDRRKRGCFVVCRKRGLDGGGPGPGRKEKEPKERGSFRHRWLPGGIYPTELAATDAVSREKTKVVEKSPMRWACECVPEVSNCTIDRFAVESCELS